MTDPFASLHAEQNTLAVIPIDILGRIPITTGTAWIAREYFNRLLAVEGGTVEACLENVREMERKRVVEDFQRLIT